MQRRPRSTPNVILNSSRNHNQNQVFEITLDEEDEKTSFPLTTRQHLGYSQPCSKRGSGITTSDNSKISIYDKENIPEKYTLLPPPHSKASQSKNSFNQNLSGLSSETRISKPHDNKNYQTNGTSELLENLDANIEEFKQLISCNLRIIEPQNIKEENDSKILEISRLSLKLEESKFCTENDPSELKILREFETKINSVHEKKRVHEIKAPEVTQVLEFEGESLDINNSDSKFIKPFLVSSSLDKNDNYLTEPRDMRQRTECSEQQQNIEKDLDSGTKSQIFFLDMDRNVTNQIFENFLEDYQSIIMAFRRVLPDFQAKSHIVRYLATHEALGYEFLYSVMLDLKELEKTILLADHKKSTQENFFKEQIAELIKISETYREENVELQRRIEKITAGGNQSMNADISRGGGNHVKYMRGHYQALLMKTNEFYAQKFEMLKQSLLSKQSHAATKLTIENIFEDLEEEMGLEGIQDGLKQSIKKLKEVHNLIGNTWTDQNKFCLPFEKLETKSTQFFKTLDTRKTTDMNSTGPLTTRPHDILEFERNDDYITEESYLSKEIEDVKSGPETRLNSSELEQKSLEYFLKNKESELGFIRRKEQTYQNLIYSLTQELKSANKKSTPLTGFACETQQSDQKYQAN